MRRALLPLLLVGCVACAAPEPPADGRGVLVFSRTVGFRHGSIPAGVAALRELGAELGLPVEATEDPAAFEDATLARFRAVVFLNTTGDVLDLAQEAAFERFVRSGGGFLGVHAAADTEYEWPFYGELVGARFASHPAVQEAVVRVLDRAHPSTAHLDAKWTRTDEWYDYRARPSDAFTVLCELDESTYEGASMGAPHPIAWWRELGDARALYTGGGHTAESYAEPAFRAHLAGALRFVAQLDG